MTREELRDGWVDLMRRLYEPDAYFERLAAGLGPATTPFAPARADYWRRHPVARVTGQARHLVRAAVLYARLMRRVESVALRRRYRAELWRELRHSNDPGRLFGYVIRCAMHYHHVTLAGDMARRRDAVVNSI